MFGEFCDHWNCFSTAREENLCDIICKLCWFVIVIVKFVVAVIEALGVLQVVHMIFYPEHYIHQKNPKTNAIQV